MHRRGLKRTEETKERIRLARTGAKQSPETIAKRIAKTTGQKRTMQFRLDRSGEKSPHWKGGISPYWMKLRQSRETRHWRNDVLKEQGEICQKCGALEGLHIHHLQNFAEHPALRHVISNGIVICGNCHREFHKEYGYSKNTGEQMEEFLGSDLNQ